MRAGGRPDRARLLHRLAGDGRRRTALDAADVHALAGALDDIVDHAEEAADQLGLYGVEAPMEQAGSSPTAPTTWRPAAVDACETVANVLEGMSIKRARR